MELIVKKSYKLDSKDKEILIEKFRSIRKLAKFWDVSPAFTFDMLNGKRNVPEYYINKLSLDIRTKLWNH